MKAETLINLSSWLCGVIALVCLRVYEVYLNNIIFARKFYMLAILSGVVVAFCITYLLYKMYPEYYKEYKEGQRKSAILCLFTSIVVFTLFGMSYMNMDTASRSTNTVKATVIEKSRSKLYGSTYLTLHNGSYVECFQPSKKEWEKIKEGQIITIKKGRGIFDYEYIFSFN